MPPGVGRVVWSLQHKKVSHFQRLALTWSPGLSLCIILQPQHGLQYEVRNQISLNKVSRSKIKPKNLGRALGAQILMGGPESPEHYNRIPFLRSSNITIIKRIS